MTKNEIRLCLFGAGLDTGNLGVSALCRSVVHGLLSRLPHAGISVFDHGRGCGPLPGEPKDRAERCGARHSKRLHQPETLSTIRLALRLGGMGNPAAQRIARAQAILDISGGDSFTDLYGPWRFRSVCLPKIIALENRKPLVLLPQTYGPFRGQREREIASRIVRKATLAFARDARSYEVLRDLLGSAHDPARHVLGVDVAFLLPVVEPTAQHALPQVVERRRSGLPMGGRGLLGLNVSGLIFNDPKAAAERYRFRADYRRALLDIALGLLAQHDADLLLVPHVLTAPGHPESDPAACQQLRQDILQHASPGVAERVHVLPSVDDERQIKWVISRCDWFCGTRMHATIASLSTGTPACAISYSPKTLGVFETAGQGQHVVDPTELGTADVVERVLASAADHASIRAQLAQHLPTVLSRASEQMDQIARSCAAGLGTPAAV